jgi:SWI/SNF-related matrix-associated actin-dependent regulator 1 of chromatin subfamily A
MDTINLPAKLYTISANMALGKRITRTFVAAELRTTPNGAVYLYGHGITDPTGVCTKCGRALTHPGSILIGIGPECLKDYAAREYRLEALTEADIAKLKAAIRQVKVDHWFPIAVIKSAVAVSEQIQVPTTHRFLSDTLKQPGNGQTMGVKSLSHTAALDTTGKFVIIKFPYAPPMVESIRQLEGRKWNGEKRFWYAWASQNNLVRLQSLGFTLDTECLALLNQPNTDDITPLIIPGFKGVLRPYQITGVKFIDALKGRAIIADEMRLGKTIQAVAWLQLRKAIALPALVVCPNTIKINWEREFKKNTDIRTQIITGTQDQRIWAEAVIINYDILANTSPCTVCEGKKKLTDGRKCRKCNGTGVEVNLRADLANIPWKTVILDEAQKLSNHNTQRTKACKQAIKTARHMIPLSGTPIEKRPSQFFTLLNLLDEVNFNSWHRYMTEYAGAKLTRWGWDISGSTNTEKLHQVLKRIMLRRLKRDVLPDLPEKNKTVVPIDITNREVYTKADCDFTNWVRTQYGTARADKAERAKAITKVNYLKQLTTKGKLAACVQWIEDTLESVDKIVVFASYQDTVKTLLKELKKYNPVAIYGATTLKQRQEAVDAFQKPLSDKAPPGSECRVLVGNIKAAGLGIELSASHNFVFVEYEWNPTDHDQAEERGLSAAQQSKEYNVWYLVGADTIEEDIIELMDRKRQVLDAVLDGLVTDESSLLSLLLKKRLGE